MILVSLMPLVFVLIVLGFCCDKKTHASKTAQNRVRRCMKSTTNRRPLIINTDRDMDDLWAVHYLLNVSY